ncbi:hypothetical protein [Sphingomonas koreensis]|jgi:hypothetical protein|uniref:hypothetical protein n=1 Tax=Sphingomonas koreensis TaxID=93064 RepID=UPI000F741ABC|nr:hypothetical protein [Sphingomonas koreensis]MDC7811431.1 hypothetical protein [Sphingomonas koreensis]
MNDSSLIDSTSHQRVFDNALFLPHLIDDQRLWIARIVAASWTPFGSADAIGPLARFVARVGRDHTAEEAPKRPAYPPETAIDPVTQYVVVFRPEAVGIWFVHGVVPNVRGSAPER